MEQVNSACTAAGSNSGRTPVLGSNQHIFLGCFFCPCVLGLLPTPCLLMKRRSSGDDFVDRMITFAVVNVAILAELWAISITFLLWALLIDSHSTGVISEGRDLRMEEMWQDTTMWHIQERGFETNHAIPFYADASLILTNGKPGPWDPQWDSRKQSLLVLGAAGLRRTLSEHTLPRSGRAANMRK